MCLKSSDTIAREQQIRELTINTKQESSKSKVRTRQDESNGYEIFIIAIIHIIFALIILGRFTINNSLLLQEIYHILIDTSNETSTEKPSFLKTIK